jgi:nitrogen fixation protein NifU and related proteins
MDYKQEILDHYKNPLHMGVLDNPSVEISEANSSCGDVIKMQISIADGKVTDIAWQAVGCAVSTASASMLSDKIKGQTIEVVKQMTDEDIKEMIGELNAGRMKCATLPLRALINAIKKYDN